MSTPAPPPKPWERNQAAVTSSSNTAPGAPKPWENAEASTAAAVNSSTATTAPRPWERPAGSTANSLTSTSYGSSPYGTGTYGSGAYGGSTYSSPYGTRPGMYGSSYGNGGMYGSSYGNGGMYGSSYGNGGMYGSSYGNGSMYGSGSSMYGASGMYGSQYGSSYGGGMYGGGMYGRPMYGGGMYGGPGGMMGGMAPPFDANNPPPAPPTAWQHLLAAINGVMHFFGRLSFLVDENAHAVHFFISALLQMLDRAGSLYGEIARFILRILFRRRRAPGLKDKEQQLQQLPGPPGVGPHGPQGQFGAGTQQAPALPWGPARIGSEPPMMPTGGQWDNLWGSGS